MSLMAPIHPEDAKFCTEFSLAVGEPLAGSGVHPQRNILIRWPKGRWQHSLRLAAEMGDPLVAAIEGAVAAGWRINLIDRKSDPSDLIRVFVFPDNVTLDLSPADLPGFLDMLSAAGRVPDDISVRPITAPLVLCCTHGKHDACCAKWGFAIYKALAAEAARIRNFDVWEVTHLGGCRLSAGVLVLPALRKYGRLRPVDAPELLAAEARGMPYLPCYRGASHLDPAAQVAEVAGLHQLARLGLHGVARVRATGPDIYDISLPGGTATMHAEADQLRSYGSCADLKAKMPLKPKTVWRARLISLTQTHPERTMP